jgi:hypothetical protein
VCFRCSGIRLCSSGIKIDLKPPPVAEDPAATQRSPLVRYWAWQHTYDAIRIAAEDAQKARRFVTKDLEQKVTELAELNDTGAALVATSENDAINCDCLVSCALGHDHG